LKFLSKLNIFRLSHVEFTRTGQPKILGRYAVHFHMIGNAHDSYVNGIAVHHSFARVTTIHATHYLRFTNNVGYAAVGHNVFLEDGIERHNHIEGNLIMSAREASFML